MEQNLHGQIRNARSSGRTDKSVVESLASCAELQLLGGRAALRWLVSVAPAATKAAMWSGERAALASVGGRVARLVG